MANHLLQFTWSPAEREFMDRVQHGDDFLKVQLLRYAREWYRKALEMNIETEMVRQKIAECDRLIALETKVIRILVAIAAVISLTCYIFLK